MSLSDGEELQMVQLFSPWPMVVDVFMLLCGVYGSEGDRSLVIAQIFVSGKPGSGHPLGSACPQDHGRDVRPG